MRLHLFKVTLPWNPSNAEEGDYRTSTWATSPDAAIKQVAIEMSEHPDSEATCDEDRAEFVDDITSGACTNAAERVDQTILQDVEDLLKGSGGALTPKARKDLDQIKKVLSQYG